MSKWLVCILDSDSYTYTIHDVEDTREVAKKWLVEYIENKYDSYRWESDNRLVAGYKDEFAVANIFEIQDVDWVVIWHHAYNGVDFKVVAETDDWMEARTAMTQKADEALEICDAELDYEGSNQIVIDTGIEWEVIDIIEL